ncbi:polysaccharide biosynthesis tyrosine autokinase [Ligilactobacillus saerimneri]|uniref:Chain length determinant protein n=1 Tax=Ligilactobacillus saerimneri 30a TaxID=1227363 RepID=M5J4Z5_9LACO|nr:polysaccharide biosynthesis tyrosine autokinase [Ligilactobacillus saerimneri]EKW99648.1 chain length determinant protein [Ligilactobacillus saerimneri 30a]
MDAPEVQIDYTWLWRLLKRYWIMIVGVTVVCGGLGAYKAHAIKEQVQYVAGVQVLINQKNQPTKVEAVNPAHVMGTFRDLASNEGLLHKAQKALRRDGMHDVVTHDLRRAIMVDFKEESQVLVISAQTDNPKRSELFARYVAKAFQKEYKNTVNGYQIEKINATPQVEKMGGGHKGGLKWLVLGLAGGFIVSFALAFVLDLTDKKIRSSRAVAKLGLTDLGRMGQAGAEPENTRIIQANVDLVNTGKSLVVTAPAGNIGQADLALNLAELWAKKGKQVLLVDGDLRHPQLAQRLGVTADSGLNEMTTADDLVPVATTTANLHLLPAGKALAADQESKFDRDTMQKVLEKLTGQFDHVVVVTPALTTDASAREWVACVTGTVMVVQNNVTTVDDIREAMAALALGKATVLGYVMNSEK